MYTLSSKQVINKPIEEVFSFFERPENLSLITPPWLNFNILTPEPLSMKSGAIFDYRIKIFSIPSIWKTLIIDYKAPYRFVDVQAEGPYKKWEHTHTFEKVEEGTLISDKVEYDLYGGWVGKIINEVYIKYALKSIFAYRARKISKLFHEKSGSSSERIILKPQIQLT